MSVRGKRIIGGIMKIADLWNVSALLEKISLARVALQESPHKCFRHKNGGRACMVDVISSPSRYQTQEIAEIFGLEYDELLMNEEEMEVFRRHFADCAGELLAELNQRVLTPKGYSFSLGYDQEGNFGLLLHQNPSNGKEEEKRKDKYPIPRLIETSEGIGS